MSTVVGLIATNALSVCDRVTWISFLVDIGADLCVFPAAPNDKRKLTPTANLMAMVANGSIIDTWGQRAITFTLGQGKPYHHNST